VEAVVELSKFGLNEYTPASFVSAYSPVTCQATAQHKFNCNYNSKYPAYDGSCNNPKNPRMGMAYTCHRRLLPPDFSDGVKAIRRSVTGQELPNARLISNILLPDVPEVNNHQTQMVMQWGQSIVHDQSRTPINLGKLKKKTLFKKKLIKKLIVCSWIRKCGALLSTSKSHSPRVLDRLSSAGRRLSEQTMESNLLASSAIFSLFELCAGSSTTVECRYHDDGSVSSVRLHVQRRAATPIVRPRYDQFRFTLKANC
jgi:hypothetical protein